jgi:hypothetical protein
MAHSRHAHILMDPAEYDLLEVVARRAHVSVAELFRTAVRERYLRRPTPATSAVSRLAALSLDLPAWDELERELAEAKDGGVP